MSNTDCKTPGLNVCNANTCVGCVADSDCVSGKKCQNNTCVADSSGGGGGGTGGDTGSSSNLVLYLAIGGGVLLLIIIVIIIALSMSKKATPTVAPK